MGSNDYLELLGRKVIVVVNSDLVKWSGDFKYLLKSRIICG